MLTVNTKTNVNMKMGYTDTSVNTDTSLPLVQLTEQQKEICEKLKIFYEQSGWGPKTRTPEQIMEGIAYLRHLELETNLDRRAQIAHSFRELLYPITKYKSQNGNDKNDNKKRTNKKEKVKRNLEETGFVAFEQSLDNILETYDKLTDIAHHGVDPKSFSPDEIKNLTEEEFNNLIEEFLNNLLSFFYSMDEACKNIRALFSINPGQHNQKQLREKVTDFTKHPKLKQIFYYEAKVSEEWSDWLRRNSFFKELVQGTGKSGHEENVWPIVNYLFRLAEPLPERAVDIILSVPISKKNFKQETVEGFLRILLKLPPDQLARVIPKMGEEKWVILLARHDRWGYWYKDLLETLYEVKDYKNLITLSKNVLAIRKEGSQSRPISAREIFYLEDISETGVFDYLADIDEKYLESAFSLITEVVGKIITVRKPPPIKKGEITFKFNNEGHLLWIDIFKLDRKQEKSPHRTEILQAVATMKELIDRLIAKNANNSQEIRGIYKTYIKPLPDSQLTWRFKLYAMSLSPKTFKSELKDAFFRLFEFNDYNEILRGAEYLRTLKAGFPVLSKQDKRQYVKQSLELFSGKVQKGNQDLRYLKGSDIFSMIESQMIEAEKSLVEKEGFKLDPGFEPQPYSKETKAEYILPIKPIRQEEFSKLSISEIATKLHNEWSFEKLTATSDEPGGIRLRGVGELLRKDISQRLKEYIDNAHNFFDPPALDPHHTYSFLSGIEDTIKSQKELPAGLNWDRFIGLLIKIKRLYEESPPPVERTINWFNLWHYDWESVVSGIADIMKQLLAKKGKSPLDDIQPYRNQLIEIIGFLLAHPDPKPDDDPPQATDTKESANAIILNKGLTPLKSDYEIDEDPFTQAINSIRGQGFEALMNFIFRESKKFNEEEEVKIKDDIKELFESTIDKERSRALMFMFGYYFPAIYYKDKKWAMSLLPKIFPKEKNKKNLYTASWEGYLSNGNVYQGIFFENEVQKIYLRALDLKDSDYRRQRPFKDPNEGIAQHLALALLHYENFKFNNPLFEKFWKKGKTKRQKAFVEFLGRRYISGDEDEIKQLLKKEPRIKERLEEIWDWYLNENEHIDPEVLKEFGYWMNTKNRIFETKWLVTKVKKTLTETGGILTFGYWFEQSISEFIKESPKDTIYIISLYLPKNPNVITYNKQWVEALGTLYKNNETKPKTSDLINKIMFKYPVLDLILEKIINPKK